MRYYGPRFFRLQIVRPDGSKTSVSYGENRSHATSDARGVYKPTGCTCTLETLDDRHPANILASETL
jgi:hypothetical protein